ncbi:hypothetical protein COO72_12515 [Bifidobacterium callitrichos]|nr:hypothetical protein COO72_12515 [Bifidobacterium callitrichos]
MNGNELRTILKGYDKADDWFVIRATPETMDDIAEEIDPANSGDAAEQAERVALDGDMNELTGTALRYLTIAWLAFLGMDAHGLDDGRGRGWAMTGTDGYGRLAQELRQRAVLAAANDDHTPDDDHMERIAHMSDLTLDQLDDRARDTSGDDHSTVHQRYLEAVCHEISRLIGDDD